MVIPRHTSVPARTARGSGLLVVGMVLIVGACSGDDLSDATTAPTTVPLDTTVAPSTTTTPPSTTTAPETAVVSTAPVTTVPPTTALVPEATTTTTVADPDVQAVMDGLLASWTAFNEIKLDPLNDEKLPPVAETHRGELLDGIVDLIEEFRIQGRRSVTNPEAPAQAIPLAETVTIDGTRATIEYCWVNSNIFVETGGNPDGTDRVIDDSLSVSRVLETFELIAGRWVNVESVTVVTIKGETSCEPVL